MVHRLVFLGGLDLMVLAVHCKRLIVQLGKQYHLPKPKLAACATGRSGTHTPTKASCCEFVVIELEQTAFARVSDLVSFLR